MSRARSDCSAARDKVAAFSIEKNAAIQRNAALEEQLTAAQDEKYAVIAERDILEAKLALSKDNLISQRSIAS